MRIAISSDHAGFDLKQLLLNRLEAEPDLSIVDLGTHAPTPPVDYPDYARAVAEVVARGDAEIGFQQMSELKPVEGIDIIGPLPKEVQAYYSFSAAVMKASQKREEAKAFLDFMRTEPVRAAMKQNLLEPA
jgi:ABC-type molybdate transport system substrate-binding protein